MENYEKKYKEALERARKLGTPAMPLDPKRSVGEQIFPELRESEDERIRKELLVFFENEMEKYGNEEWDGCFHTTDVIAWLEKQKSNWSEEDEEMIRGIRRYLNELGNWLSDKNEEKAVSIYKAADWLKSVKKRPQEQNYYDKG